MIEQEYVGIDVSKAYLDVAYGEEGEQVFFPMLFKKPDKNRHKTAYMSGISSEF